MPSRDDDKVEFFGNQPSSIADPPSLKADEGSRRSRPASQSERDGWYEHLPKLVAQTIPPMKGVTPKYRGTSPTKRGEEALRTLWKRVRTEIIEKFPEAQPPQDPPAALTKFTPYSDTLELMVKYPVKTKNLFEWLRTTPIKFDGLQVSKLLPQLESNQSSLGVCDPKPAWTFHGHFIPYELARKVLADSLSSNKSSMDPIIYEKDVDGLESWDVVLGGKNPYFILADLLSLFHGRTFHQDSSSPIPREVAIQAWRDTMEANFPSLLSNPGTYKPKHLFWSTQIGGGYVISTRDAAAGGPYSWLDLEGKRFRARRPKKQGRFTKADVQRAEMQILVKWVKEGMPMTGDLAALLKLPATPTFRGDREVPLSLRRWATQVPQLAALLPSRSVIIVPAILTFAQMIYAQAIGDVITGQAPPEYDWVDAGVTKQRLEEIRSQDVAQTAGDRLVVGADCSTWDRDVTGQDHLYEAMTYCHFFPEEVTLLYVDSPAALDVDEEWAQRTLDNLNPGQTRVEEVPIIGSDGSRRTSEVTVEAITFNMHEFIFKTMTLINSSGVAMGSHVFHQTPDRFYAPDVGTGHVSQSRFLESNGGRRSGDAITGYGNNDTNLRVLRSGIKMLSTPDAKADVLRRLAASSISPDDIGAKLCTGKPFLWAEDLFARGDDLIGVFRGKPGVNIPLAVAAAYSVVSRRANPSKQESSGIPGSPSASFANIHMTTDYLGKLASRNWKRFFVQESAGVSLETLSAVQEENDTEERDILIATTLTALARLAPLSGFPVMDKHPAIEDLVEFAVHNDEYRLAYVDDSSLTKDGNLDIEAAKSRLDRMIQVMSRAQARILSRRGGSVVPEDVVEEFATNDIHNLVANEALRSDYKPTRLVTRVNNRELFIEGRYDDL